MSVPTHSALSANAVKRITAVIESMPHCVKLGVRVTEIARGSCTAYIAYRPEFIGDPSRGVLHTGVVTALIDTVAGAATYAMLPAGTPIATLDMRIDYLKPIESDRRLYAGAELYRLTRRIAFVRASAYQNDPENQVAHCVASFMISGIGLSIQAQ